MKSSQEIQTDVIKKNLNLILSILNQKSKKDTYDVDDKPNLNRPPVELLSSYEKMRLKQPTREQFILKLHTALEKKDSEQIIMVLSAAAKNIYFNLSNPISIVGLARLNKTIALDFIYFPSLLYLQMFGFALGGHIEQANVLCKHLKNLHLSQTKTIQQEIEACLQLSKDPTKPRSSQEDYSPIIEAAKEKNKQQLIESLLSLTKDYCFNKSLNLPIAQLAMKNDKSSLDFLMQNDVSLFLLIFGNALSGEIDLGLLQHLESKHADQIGVLLKGIAFCLALSNHITVLNEFLTSKKQQYPREMGLILMEAVTGYAFNKKYSEMFPLIEQLKSIYPEYNKELSDIVAFFSGVIKTPILNDSDIRTNLFLKEVRFFEPDKIKNYSVITNYNAVYQQIKNKIIISPFFSFHEFDHPIVKIAEEKDTESVDFLMQNVSLEHSKMLRPLVAFGYAKGGHLEEVQALLDEEKQDESSIVHIDFSNKKNNIFANVIIALAAAQLIDIDCIIKRKPHYSSIYNNFYLYLNDNNQITLCLYEQSYYTKNLNDFGIRGFWSLLAMGFALSGNGELAYECFEKSTQKLTSITLYDSILKPIANTFGLYEQKEATNVFTQKLQDSIKKIEPKQQHFYYLCYCDALGQVAAGYILRGKIKIAYQILEKINKISDGNLVRNSLLLIVENEKKIGRYTNKYLILKILAYKGNIDYRLVQNLIAPMIPPPGKKDSYKAYYTETICIARKLCTIMEAHHLSYDQLVTYCSPTTKSISEQKKLTEEKKRSTLTEKITLSENHNSLRFFNSSQEPVTVAPKTFNSDVNLRI